MEKQEYEFGQTQTKIRRGPGRMGTGEKAKDLVGTWKKLLLYCKKYAALFIASVFCAIVGTVLQLLGPDKLSDIAKYIEEGLVTGTIDLDSVIKTGSMLICFYVISWVMSTAQHWMMASVTQRVSKSMRKDISHKINQLPIWYYNRNSTGDVLSRVTNDVDTIGQSFNQSIGNLISQIVLFVGSFFMMIITNWIMALTAVAATCLGFIFMMAIMGRSQKYFTRQQRNLGALNGHIEEIYAGHTIVKAYNGEEEAIRTFDELNKELRKSGFRAHCLSGLMMPIMTFIGNFAYVAVCIVGGSMALNGKIDFSVIVAFVLYVRYFTQPLSQIAQSMQTLQSAAAAGERVFEFLEAEEMENENNKTKQLKDVKGAVEFDHVKFGYEDTDKTVIHDFSAVAKPGQKIAIVGPTGAGKTTMVNLLMRFHELQGGEIRIDGISTKDIKRENVHEQFCMVLQDTWLFEGTVRENLIYSTPNVSDEKMIEACKAVGLHHFIRTLPKGYDTVLTDQVNLSQGQKQQLTIARAMIADKPMLILDEATSSVDTRTELKIQEAMDQLMHGRTSFVIAHRLSTIKNSDLILVMKDGDIIESGKHEELLEKGGFYAELYNSQFEHEKIIKEEYLRETKMWDDVYAQSPSVDIRTIELSVEDMFNTCLHYFAEHTKKVLDFGCGSGDVLFQYYQYAPRNRGIGIDVSKEGIKSAKETAKKSNCNKLNFFQGDVEFLDIFENEKFDGIILSNVLDVMPEESAKGLLEKLNRVLKKNGYWFIKLNPYYSAEELQSFGYRQIEPHLYDEEGVLRLHQELTEYWKKFLSPYGTIIRYLEFPYSWQSGMNRLFLMIK